VFSAAKPPEDGDGLVLRCWNARPEPMAGAWRFGRRVARAVRLRADERADGAVDLPVTDGGHAVPVVVDGYGVATVRVELWR
jgi:hypothetical protein